MKTDTERIYRSPAEYVDSGHPAVRDAAESMAPKSASPADKVRAYFYAVRDDIDYGFPGGQNGTAERRSTADFFRDLEIYRASSVLTAGYGYCVSKAAVCAALCRAAGIPARVGFADVRNHLSTSRLREAMGTDLFAWHGYVEVLLEGRWVKVTPTFNASFCRRFGVRPLDFDGASDALLQPYDSAGRAFLSYVHTHGAYHDVPARFLAEEMLRLYPGLENHTP